ncbi:mitochondrial ribosomal protein L55 [Brevipalpus obovatus]|uniref:mitochondrial ribosomal protein L55 n=1 Tax=Brevipalpus obovatus TaxID=246614 RepID=UPI003D9F94EC
MWKMNHLGLMLSVRQPVWKHVRLLNSNACLVAKVQRPKYCRMYDTVFVYEDGSTVNMRYDEPVSIIRLPIVYEELQNEEDKKAWTLRRRRKELFTAQKSETNVKFDRMAYLKHFKR